MSIFPYPHTNFLLGDANDYEHTRASEQTDSCKTCLSDWMLHVDIHLITKKLIHISDNSMCMSNGGIYHFAFWKMDTLY